MKADIAPARFPCSGAEGAFLSPPLARLAISGSLPALLVLVVLPALPTDTSRWTATEGVLVEAVPRGGGVRGRLRIRYTYEVDGRTDAGRRAALWSDSVPLRVVHPSPEAWRPGARLRAYHTPLNPKVPYSITR